MQEPNFHHTFKLYLRPGPRYSSNYITWIFHRLSTSNIWLCREVQVNIQTALSLFALCGHGSGWEEPPAITPGLTPLQKYSRNIPEMSWDQRHNLSMEEPEWRKGSSFAARWRKMFLLVGHVGKCSLERDQRDSSHSCTITGAGAAHSALDWRWVAEEGTHEPDLLFRAERMAPQWVRLGECSA